MDNKDVMITFENLEEYDNNAKQRKIAYNQISDTYIDTVSSHNSLIRGKEIKLSWEELRDNIQAGNFSDIYIGDYKEITLTTGEEVVMEVAGIDLYWFPYRDNSATIDLINHHVDFISRDCLSGFRRMNATKTNNGTASVQNPWVASELYDTMNNENAGIYATLPSDLKSCIINKYTMAGCRYSAGGLYQQILPKHGLILVNFGCLPKSNCLDIPFIALPATDAVKVTAIPYIN